MSECLSQTRIVPKNHNVCLANKCASKWRLCKICVQQGFTDVNKSRVVKPSKGLCKFHEDEGESARKSRTNPESGTGSLEDLRSMMRVKEEDEKLSTPEDEDSSTQDLIPATAPLSQGESKPEERITEGTNKVPPIKGPPREYTGQDASKDPKDENLSMKDRLTVKALLPQSELKPEEKVVVDTDKVHPTNEQPRENYDQYSLGDPEDEKLSMKDRLTAKALLPQGELEPGAGIMVDTDEVRPMKGQPREHFDQDALAELAGSILSVGQLVPATVRRLSGDNKHKFEIEDGERRWRACKLLGIKLRVISNDFGDNFSEQFARSAIANFGRVGHTPLEFARAIHAVIKDLRWTKRATATAFGVSVQTLSNHLPLLELDPEVLSLMSPSKEGGKSLGLISALALIPYPSEFQVRLAKEIVSDDLSVSEARRRIRKLARGAGIRPLMGSRMRRPSDDHNSISTKLKRLSQGLSDILDEDYDLAEIFKGRSGSDRASIRALLRSIESDVSTIKENLGEDT